MDTAELLGADKADYLRLIGGVAGIWPAIAKDVLAALHFPRHPLRMEKFVALILQSGTATAKKFRTEEAKCLFAGLSAYSVLPLNNPASAAIGLVLLVNWHLKGWPIPRGGSGSLASAPGDYFLCGE